MQFMISEIVVAAIGYQLLFSAFMSISYSSPFYVVMMTRSNEREREEKQ